ncbi:hypothetical protein, partial [Paraburkholderia humisilvae]
ALRREDVPVTPDTVAEEISDLVAQYQAPPGQSSPDLRHWLDNMPVISNIIGIGEGIAHGDAQEIVSSVPVISNIYNAAEGAATGDSKRTATALITLVPYVGSGYIIADGVASNDTAETVGGVMGLGLDFVTEGEGHLLTRSRVVGHSALADGKVASRTFSHHEVPSAVRLQAQHSLGALRDLGMDDRALMLTDKAGEHGSVGDPFALVAAREEAAPSGAEMQQLLERLTPVPEDKRPVAMRRSEGGTWQDPQTLAHYAQIGAKLYRVAKDEAASSGGYVVWNPVDAHGGGRERTIRLENRDGQWQQARNAPGLKGGAPEPHRLKPPARFVPTLPEHIDLLKDLPEELAQAYRSSVRWFLVHLEEQGQSWSQLVPAGSGAGARPAALEQAVNEGIRHHGLRPNTRAAINQAFGFKLQGKAEKPGDAEQPAASRARPYSSNRLQGVSDPDNKHYSGPTGAGRFNMDSVYWRSGTE